MFSTACICDVLCSRHTSRGKDSSLPAGELAICFAERHSQYATNLKKNKTRSYVVHHCGLLTKILCAIVKEEQEVGRKNKVDRK